MENLFSIGELAKYQNISKQTLIFYDKIGLFRPITLFPFPEEALRALAPGRRFLVMEQNTGQMVEDVRLALFAQPGISASSVLWHGIMPGLFIGADALREPMLQALKEK